MTLTWLLQDYVSELRAVNSGKYPGRAGLAGDYTSHQCGLRVEQPGPGEQGNWSCLLEEYRWGDWLAGARHAANLTIRLENPIIEETTTRISEQPTEAEYHPPAIDETLWLHNNALACIARMHAYYTCIHDMHAHMMHT